MSLTAEKIRNIGATTTPKRRGAAKPPPMDEKLIQEHKRLKQESQEKTRQERAKEKQRDLESDHWPDLVDLGSPNLPPMAADILPSWAGAFAKALAQSTETPPELAAGMVLAVASTACARRLRVLVSPGHVEPSNLWIAVSLAPANRKSSVHTAACKPLLDWEREEASRIATDIAAVQSHNKTLQAQAKAARDLSARSDDPDEREAKAKEAAELEAAMSLEPTVPQLWTSDATAERLGTLMAEHGECIAWMSAEAGLFDILSGRYSRGIPNLDLVLKAWSGDPERVDRGSRPPVFLSYPRLTVGLTPQPDVLRSLSAQPGLHGRGLLGRFIYFLPRSTIGFRDLSANRPGACIPGHIASDYSAGIRSMLDWPSALDANGEETPHLLRLSQPAYAEYEEFAKTIERRMQPGKDLEQHQVLAGKLQGMAPRIAAVFHGIEHAQGEPWKREIASDTMHNALAVAAVALEHGIAAMGLMGTDPSIAAACKVWDWLERGRYSGITVRNIYKALQGSFPRMDKLVPALEALEERGYIKILAPEKKTEPGRNKSPTVVIRPDILRGWL